MRKIFIGIYLVLVAGILLSTSRGWAQPDPSAEYCVFEQQDRSKVASRIDWLSVAKCSDAAGLAGGGWLSIESKMTFAQAAAMVDAMRVNWGVESSGEQDRFHSHCDHNYVVWKNIEIQPPKRAFSRADANPGPQYILEKSNLCCEDAAAMAFPESSGRGDCRTFELMSVPGTRVSQVRGRWVGLNGPVRIPRFPPIDLPESPIKVAPIQWPGSYRGNCTYDDAGVNLHVSSEATMVVTQTGPPGLRLSAPGAPEPVDLTITSDPATAKGTLSKRVGTAAAGGGAVMEYTAVLQGDSLLLTMAAATEGHVNLPNPGWQRTHKGSAAMNCTLLRLSIEVPAKP